MANVQMYFLTSLGEDTATSAWVALVHPGDSCGVGIVCSEATVGLSKPFHESGVLWMVPSGEAQCKEFEVEM